MIRYASLVLVAGLLGAIVGNVHVVGSNPSAAPDKIAPAPEKAAQPKAPGRTLTIEDVGEALDNLGYEYASNKTDGGLSYTVTIKRDDWTYVINLTMSTNKQFIWFDAPLHMLPAEGNLDGEAMYKVMRESWKIGPSHFAVATGVRRLFLLRPIENENVTNAKLRAAIEMMVKDLRGTASAWDVPAMGKPAKPDGAVSRRTAPTPDADALRAALTVATTLATDGAGTPANKTAVAADPTLTMINHTASRVSFYVDGTKRCTVEGGKSCTINIKAGSRRIDTYDVNGKLAKTKTFTAENGQAYTYSVWFE